MRFLVVYQMLQVKMYKVQGTGSFKFGPFLWRLLTKNPLMEFIDFIVIQLKG